MKTSLLTPAMLAAFTAGGGAIAKVDTNASVGITNREWGQLVRGEIVEEVDMAEIRAEREMERAREARWYRMNGEMGA